MKKVRITVKKITKYEDLMAEYENNRADINNYECICGGLNAISNYQE